MSAPVLDEVDAEMGDKIKIAKINVDENPETAGKFGVMSIPTLLLFKNGEVVDKVIGYQPKDALVQMIQKHL
jgi:thioredoxin 1